MCQFCAFFQSIHFDIACLAPFKKIFVLVSGGMDSTLLAEYIHAHYPKTTYFVNCYNPYETSITLSDFESRGLLVVKPAKQYNYGQILKNAFLKLNDATILRQNKTYGKHVFGCCKIIKHKAFLADDLFKEPDTVVVSGIKYGDGKQRRLWLYGLRYAKATTNHAKVAKDPTFFYRHIEGQLYCYPFRDCFKREFPDEIMQLLRQIHPKLQHSGCAICPVLILFHDKINEPIRYKISLRFLQALIRKSEFTPSKLLLQYCTDLNINIQKLTEY